jgi:uncharacterized protein (TIGR03067 family)
VKHAFHPCILLFLFLGTVAAHGDEDLLRFAGTWRMAQAEMAGKAAPADALKGITIKIEGTSYQVTSEREPTTEPVERGTFSLQPEAKPKAITLKVTRSERGQNSARDLRVRGRQAARLLRPLRHETANGVQVSGGYRALLGDIRTAEVTRAHSTRICLEWR